MPSRHTRRAAAALLCLLMAGTTGARAADADAIRAALSAGEWGRARALAEAATQANGQDAEAWYLLAAAHNRQGHPADALTALARADLLGADPAELGFEGGWALLALDRPAPAAEHLARYLERHPDNAKAHEMLGRAALALGWRDAAARAFDRALALDPALAPSVSWQQARLARARGDRAGTVAALDSYLTFRPDDQKARQVRDALAGPATATGNSWTLYGGLRGGYDDNVIRVGEGVPLPADISQKGSAWAGLAAGGRYEIPAGAGDALSFGYDLAYTDYASLREAESLDNALSLAWRHVFRGGLAGTLGLGASHTEIGGESFRNSVTLGPSILWQVAERAVLEVRYDYARQRYSTDSAPAQRRDGHDHALGATAYVNLPGWQLDLRGGYAFTRSDTRGSDHDRDSHTLFVGATRPLGHDVSAQLNYAHSFVDYDNPNSLAGLPAGFAFAREDDTDLLGAGLSWQPVDWASLYARVDHTRADSNIAFFDHSQTLWTVGVTLTETGAER